MDKGTCTAEGCDRPAIKVGLCGKHYQRRRNHGDPNWEPPQRGGNLCSVEGCEEPTRGKGFCAKHYDALRRHGDPLWQRERDKRCSEEGCDRPHYGHGWCRLHWNRWYDHGSTAKPERRPKPLADRFWKRVDKNGPIVYAHLGPCWLWTGGKVKGYGMFSIGDRRYVLAHRWIYEQIVGDIPGDEEICHRCDNPSCVRPTHLRTGSHDRNMKEMQARRRSGNTECGTSGGYRRHFRLGESPCEPCREAQRVYARKGRERDA